jgi:N-acyl-D-glutamate deacylase
MRPFIRRICFCFLATVVIPGIAAELNDIAIIGGRVIDPETGLDATRNVGIRAGKIVAISESPLKGKKIINATRLIVSPGAGR